jgi:hypothetical protein
MDLGPKAAVVALAAAGLSACGSGAADPFRLVAPLSTATVTSRRPTLRWHLDQHSDGAHVQICRDRACTIEVTSFDAPGASGAPPADLPAGVLFWRAFPHSTMAADAASTPSPSATWELEVGAASAPLDTSWGSFLDLNGDGYADLLIGSYVHFGGPQGLAETPAVILDSSLASSFPFDNPWASAGDVNGDGYGDLVVLDPDGASDFIAAYVYLGSANGPSPSPSFKLGGSYPQNEFFNLTLAGVGDVNGDGYADIVVGDPNVGTGAAYVYLGSAAGPSRGYNLSLQGTAGSLGISVAGAGDVNGDGYADLLIADRSVETARGFGYVYLGGPRGPTDAVLVALTGPDGGDLATPSVAAAGDVDGDGYADLLIGSPDGETGGAFLYLGGPFGPTAKPSVTLRGADSAFGTALIGAGDVNGDGYADFVVTDALSATSNPQTMSSGLDLALVFLGGPQGPSATPTTTLSNPDVTGTLQTFQSPLGAGDFNGDGYSDFTTPAVGQRQLEYVYFGGDGGLTPTPGAKLD